MRRTFQRLKRNRLASFLLCICDKITIPRKLTGQKFPLWVNLLSNHWVNSDYEEDIRSSFKEICRRFGLKTFIDIGANVGIFCADFLSLDKENKAIAIEPNSKPFRCLEKTKKRAGLENFYPFKIALSDHNGFQNLHFDPMAPSTGGLNPVSNGKFLFEIKYGGFGVTEKVHAMTLDEFCKENLPKNTKPEIIKIDAEGEELKILMGAVNTIKQFHPVLFFECSHSGEEIQQFLSENDYIFYDTHLTQIDRLTGFNIAITS